MVLTAQQWAPRFKSANGPGLLRVCEEFVKEIGEEARRPKNKSVPLCIIIRRQGAKFNQVAKLTGKVRPSMWNSLVKTYMPQKWEDQLRFLGQK